MKDQLRPPPQRSRLARQFGYALGAAIVVVLGGALHPFAAFVLLPVTLGICAVAFFRGQARSPGPARWPQLLAGNSLIFALLCSVGFLGLETYYRFLCDRTDGMINTLVCESWNARHFRKNNFGVRDNIDYSYTRTPGRTRLTFVGDSSTAGCGVKDVDDRFVNRIRRLHPEWEVHAIAIPGLDTSTEVDKMHNLTVSNHYQLDQLVLVYHLNDIGELMPKWVEGYKQMIADPIWKGWLCRNSYFFNLYYHWWQMRNNAYMQHYFDETEDAYKGHLWDYEKIGLLAFRNMTRIRGGRLMVVTLPYLDAMPRFRFAHEKLNQYWQQNGVPHMDLLDVFSNIPPEKLIVNSHDSHPNEYAHAVAATAIDAFLKRYITNAPAADVSAR